MSEHSKELWTARKWYYRRPGSDESWFILDAKGNVLSSPGGDCGTMRSPEPYAGYGFTEADARRIVACVNRLVPFTTEQIEAGIDLVKLVEQRDRLLRYVKHYGHAHGCRVNAGGECDCGYDAIIAKVEAK